MSAKCPLQSPPTTDLELDTEAYLSASTPSAEKARRFSSSHRLGLPSAVELLLGHVQQVCGRILVAQAVALHQRHQLLFLDWPLLREAAASDPHEYLAPLLTDSCQANSGAARGDTTKPICVLMCLNKKTCGCKNVSSKRGPRGQKFLRTRQGAPPEGENTSVLWLLPSPTGLSCSASALISFARH